MDALAAGKYLLVTSYRRNGTPVATPVWVVRDRAALGVWTAADSYKVRRIRNRPDVLVGPCDVRGRPTGRQVPGRAEATGPDTTERYRGLIARKYGIAGRLTLLGSRLRRGKQGTTGLRITLTD
ncbi:PPOX class F420-dependent oxidoreductase [Streptomyces ruber]|uniref:PPOX class F420-dependent oxidoreductase n=2 Tax=Streptomyces TaxID=1883 RepID=A0A918ER57_9ACTN|nr:PPOX class F420-dependent oxidoreductase [Streptomyces ruber]